MCQNCFQIVYISAILKHLPTPNILASVGSAVYNVSNEFAVHFKLMQGSMSNDVLDLVK